MVPVALGDQAYDITLGVEALDQLPDILRRTCPAAAYAIITDSAVGERYAPRVLASTETVAPASVYAFPAGEWNKTRDTWAEISDRMLADRIGRDGAVIALGGGVVGDLAGFVAATYHRGIPFVQVPTSLLAMIDSSIGGKTGVDTPFGKNLLGAFHQPRAVVADVQTLGTLPPVQFAAGMAEAVKHGAIADPAYLDTLLERAEALHQLDPAAVTDLIRRSVEIKAEIVADDERERGRRAILNFGHTIAHALEATSGYGLLHGEAVAIGMVAEAMLGEMSGVTALGTAQQLRQALERFNLPTTPTSTGTTDDIIDALASDKKARGGTVRFSLLERLGSPVRGPHGEWTVAVPAETVRGVIDQMLG